MLKITVENGAAGNSVVEKNKSGHGSRAEKRADYSRTGAADNLFVCVNERKIALLSNDGSFNERSFKT